MALFSQNFWKALLENLTSHRCNHLLHIWFKIMLKSSIKFIVWVLVSFWWRMYMKVCYTFSFCFQITGISCPFGATVAHELGVFHFINLNYQCDKIILFFQSFQVLLCMYHATSSEIKENFASNSTVKFLLRQSLASKDCISRGACIQIKIQQ